jgi:hypothetical protein
MPKAGEKERKRKRHKTAVHYIFYSTRNASEMLLDLPEAMFASAGQQTATKEFRA